ncbi:hypothetical protein SSP35_08_01900 [Streptomyces sp. NBRC 110611]|nr:hypothetical protein SSP35_08_01900 [Streptomyces sp. NBRC 110611]
MAVTALPCGLLIGLLLGALGGGGSVLAMPALVYLLDQTPHEATAGALVVVAVGAASGLLGHARGGRVRWAAGTAFGALGTAGSYLGTRCSTALAPGVLLTAFSGLMLVVAAMLLIRTERERRATGTGESEGEGEGRRAGPGSSTGGSSAAGRPLRGARTRLFPGRPLRIAATASAVGLLTGFFGVGGGFVVVPALTLVLGLEMPVAIGTSLLVIVVNSLTALATRAGTGALDWPLLAGFAACAALGSHLGNRLTTRLRPRTLTTAFASLLTVLAVTMAASALPRL